MAKKTYTNIHENPEQALLERYVDEIAATPLTEEEELSLCQKIAAGNSRALDTLVEKHLPLVVSIARKSVRDGVSLMDLIAEGNIGLIHAAQKFDASHGQRFSQYASYDVRKAIQDFLPVDDVRMKRSTDSLPSGGGSIEDTFTSTDEGNSMVEKIMFLPEREQVVLRAFYGIGMESMTMAEIGHKYGFTRERVRQIRNVALRHLRNLRNVGFNG